jgi:hypothetical protein
LAGGAVRAGDKCRVYDPEDDAFFNTTTRGCSFKISKAGKITGNLINGSSTRNLSDAWMQRTKDYFQAVGRCSFAAIEMPGVKRMRGKSGIEQSAAIRQCSPARRPHGAPRLKGPKRP